MSAAPQDAEDRHIGPAIDDAGTEDLLTEDQGADDRAALPHQFAAYVRTVDRPGTVAALAEVVSSRGVSIESFATSDLKGGSATITMTFSTSERLERVIAKTIQRLAIVVEVTVLRTDDPQVLAAGVVHPAPGTRFLPPAEADVTWSGAAAPGEPLLVDGQFLDVARVIEAGLAAGASRVTFSLLQPAGSR